MKTMIAMHESVMNGPAAKKHNLSPEAVADVIADYQEAFIQSMIANGYSLMTEDMRIEVVPIQRRNYVLKGKTYSSTRIYKIKATIGDPIYNRICDKFDQFRDDLDFEDGGEDQ